MRRALLIHAGAVGDFVMALRIVAALRSAGAKSVTVLGRPEIAAIAVPGGGVDAVIDLNIGGCHTLFSPTLDLPNHLRDGLAGFDIAVNMLAGSGNLGARLRELGIPRVIDIDPRPRPDWTGHVTDQWLADLRSAGINAAPGPPGIQLDPQDRQIAERELAAVTADRQGPIVLLHPGSGSRRKCWPVHRFAELATDLRSAGCRLVVSLGPVEAELLSQAETDALRQVAPVLADRPLRQAAALIAAAAVFIGNDSGMSHLSAASGTKTIAIFGPTDPALWRPLGENVVAMHAGKPGDWPGVEEVLRAALRLT